MNVWLFSLSCLAVWRLSNLVSHEPIFDWARRWSGAYWNSDVGEWATTGWLSELLTCPLCLSIWYAIPAATLVVDGGQPLPVYVVTWLAISAISSLISMAVQRYWYE